MNPLRFILPSMNVLIVNYQSDTACEYRFIESDNKLYGITMKSDRKADDLDSIKKELSTHPVVVFVMGYGVINKNRAEAAQIVSKVTSDSENFLFTFKGQDNLWFVRKSQIADVLAKLEQLSAKVIDVKCGCVNRSNDAVDEDDLRELFREEITLKESLRPTLKGSTLATMAAKRIQLPALGVIMVALIVNFMIGQSIREQYATKHAELTTLQGVAGKQTEISKSMEKLAAEFGKQFPYKYAWICDRVGVLLPEGITLSQLSVQPLTKPLEQNKKPTIAEQQIRIEGETPSAKTVSYYLRSLQQEKFGTNLRLTSIEQNAESKLFHFKIEMQL